MPDDNAKLGHHPTTLTQRVAGVHAVLGVVLLVVALLVDCLVVWNAALGVFHLAVAGYLFWWLGWWPKQYSVVQTAETPD